ncbi:MAG TPA: DUF799 domain-containing protein [Gammaproteobacteria bacterium]|nr:DUF799 domain-containing protein [Gammaproteobacteria bacterium]
MKMLVRITALLSVLSLVGCATGPTTVYDYTKLKDENPLSILVLPPLNNSLAVDAGYSFLSQVTYPLAESGYYVYPVAVVSDLFKHNGMTEPSDIHAVPVEKLREIFAADAVVYLKITEYGTSYKVLLSDTRVTAEARLVSLKTGEELWQGAATASTAEQQSTNQGLLGMLVIAVIDQVANTLSDKGHQIAGMTSVRLLHAGGANRLLHGPRAENKEH